jgi:TRAP-type mannitol/chloroaromatic compound transport system substrate-binding protein
VVVVEPPVEVFEWDMQTMAAAGTIHYKMFLRFIERVTEMSDGRLVITPHPAGAIVGPFDTLEATRVGILQAENSAPLYWTGKNPAFAVLGGLPMSFAEMWQYDFWFHELGGLEMLRGLYAEHGVHLVGIHWHSGIESLVSTVPVRRLEDFKGLKMRGPGAIVATLFADLGASLIVLPGGEIYAALAKGVIDLADWGTPALNYEFGLHEVAKYFTYPGFHHAPAVAVTVNMEAWNRLPDDIKIMLEVALQEWNWNNIQAVAYADIAAVEKMIARGNVPLTWDKAEIARLRKAAIRAWDVWGAKNPLAYKAVESQKDFLRYLGLLE